MTTRDDLVREREALRGLHERLCASGGDDAEDAVLSSIARIDALLGLTDEQVDDAVYSIKEAAHSLHTERRYLHHTAERRAQHEAHEAALHAVADLIRRST